MQTLTLAYRDDDRTPAIFAIRVIDKRHYDLDFKVIKIKDGPRIRSSCGRKIVIPARAASRL
jgi:hypothetical protein